MDFIHQQYLEDLSVCDRFLAYFAESNKTAGAVWDAAGTHVDKEIKDSFDVALSEDTQVRADYIKELEKVIPAYIERFKFCNEYAPWAVIQYPNLQHYPPGGGYKVWHTERSRASGLIGSRHIAFMTYLNDVTDAGETEFFYQGIKVQPRKGLTLMWPADWTHTHRGIPSPTQDKYVLTGWFNFTE